MKVGPKVPLLDITVNADWPAQTVFVEHYKTCHFSFPQYIVA